MQKKKKYAVSLLVSALAFVAARADEITVSDVSLSQNLASRLVTVNYNLSGDDAIVTVDFLTNGVSIGEKNFSNVYGDVNRLVATNGQTKTISWRPDKSWPGHRITDKILTAKVTAWPVADPPDYLCVALCETNIPTVRYFVSTNALPDGGLENDVYKKSLLVMRRIPAGGVRWRMGAVDEDFEGAASHADNVVKPYETAHYVTLSEDYWMGIFEVTHEQFKQATGVDYGVCGSGTNKSVYARTRDNVDICPRDFVEYRFLRGSNGSDPASNEFGTGTAYLKTFRNKTGIDFDLPTDAQWEFAARGGTTTLLWTGKPFNADNVGETDWYYSNSPVHDETYVTAEGVPGDKVRYSHPVGLKAPNPYGLYDVLGNLYELVRDCWREDLGTAEVTNPIVGGTGDRISRGGCTQRSYTPYARVTYRAPAAHNGKSTMTGFRLYAPLTLKYTEEEE